LIISGHLCYISKYGNIEDGVGPFAYESDDEDEQGEHDENKYEEATDKKEKKKEKKEIVQRFVFFDFETVQEKVSGSTK